MRPCSAFSVPLALALVFAIAPAPPGFCRTKLSALPAREATVVRMENPQATLIREERVLTLQQGSNQVDFSWKGVNIDPDSIRLSLDAPTDKARLISLSYPPAENALVWEIWASGAQNVRARISYLLADLDRLVEYKAVAAPDEKSLSLHAYLVVRNFSGEDLPDATVHPGRVPPFGSSLYDGQTEKRMIFSQARVPVDKTWTFDAGELPWDPERVSGNVGVPVSYRIANNAAASLGTFALWQGKARVFSTTSGGEAIFLGEDRLATLPVGEEASLTIGDSRDVVVTQRKMKDESLNIRRNQSGRVVLHDQDVLLAAKVENFKDSAVRLSLIQHVEGDWEMKEASHPHERKDAGTLEFVLDLPAHGTLDWNMRYVQKNIRN
ncbi:MAG: hypothetical protein KKA60_06105 [Proteobacteria bacterium]|nr:hypothetical protein [Pseudomonadota bacterium]